MKIFKYFISIIVFIFLINSPSAAQTISGTTQEQSGAEQAASKKLSVNIVAELSVTDPSKTSDAFSDYSEAAGGYYLKKTDYGISLRLPIGMLNKVEELLKEKGTLTRYNINTSDIENEYLVAIKQLDARRKLLNDYNNLIATAKFSSTLALEKELMTVVSEMENLRGKINKMENEYRFLKLDIKYFSEETKRPVVQKSSFDWINRINFYNFIGGYYAE